MFATAPAPAAPAAPARLWTYDEMVAELPETNLPTELWDGELVMPPTPTPLHQDIVDCFHDELKVWVRKHALGRTFQSPLDMVLSPTRMAQPDVMFIARARESIIGRIITGPADLVAEVISPTSRKRDRLDKRDLYEQHGVREYWLIDPEARTVEVLHLVKGEYHLAGRWRPGQTAASRLLSGFKVKVNALLGE